MLRRKTTTKTDLGQEKLMPWYYLLRNFPRIDLYCVYVNVWEKSWYYRKKKSRVGSFQDKMSDILLNENRHGLTRHIMII